MKRFLLLFGAILMTCIGVSAQARHQKVITFNGTNQYMKIPYSEDFEIPSNKSFTVTFWFNPARSVPKPNYQRIISNRDLTPTAGKDKSGWEIWGLDLKNKSFLAINSPNSQGKYDNSLSAWISKQGRLNTWYYVAFVVDRSKNQIRTYFNGSSTANSGHKDVSKWVVNNDLPIYVGCGVNGDAPAFFFKGSLDDLRFYNKALSNAEVEADRYASSVSATTEGLIAAYDFDNFNEGDQTIADVTGKHNAMLFNFPQPVITNPITNYTEAGTNSAIVGRGNTQQLERITLSLAKNSQLENVKVSLEGTTALSDISALKLYKSERADRFDPRNAGTPIASATSISGNDVTLQAIGTPELAKGDVNLWLVADLKSDATEGNDIAIKVNSIKLKGSPEYSVTGAKAYKSNIVLQRTLIWSPGDNGSKDYRIPAIVRLANGNLVASIDKRKNGFKDLPNDIDVEVKISTDNGVSWGSPITVAKGSPSHGYGDAAMTTDGTNIYMVLVGGNGLWSKDPNNSIQMYYTKSADGGNSWEPLRNITEDIKGKKYPYGGFFGSGNGIITTNGRICFVAAMRVDAKPAGQMDNVLVYSDDKGQSWKVSPVARANGDESKVVELANGNLLISSRNRASGANARSYVISSDGGQTWSSVKKWNDLMGNACNAGISRYTLTRNGEQKNRLLHTLPASKNRENLTLFLSEDEGQSWTTSRVICKGEAAYSEIVILPNGEIGIISEENDHPAYDIYFTKVSLNWLTKGKETYQKQEKQKCETPTISPKAGMIVKFPIQITITSLTEDAKIYYTTDGSTPTISSTLYTAEFTLEAPSTIKAIAVKEDYYNSDVSEATYTKRTTWDIPTGTIDASRYVTELTTSGADTDISYSNSASPSKLVVNIPNEIVTKQGQTFTMHIKSTDDMKWTHAILFADWNKNFSFDDKGELVHMEGIDADGPKDPNHDLYKKGNESVRDFTITINVPKDATVGKTLMRLQFNNAWHKKNVYNHSHSAMDDILEGRVYDISIDIKENSDPTAINEVENTSLKVYPTTIKDNITIECKARATAKIYTISGTLVKTFPVNGKTIINCSSLPQGVYLLAVGKKCVKIRK